jgi:hypothetical protein
VVFRAQQFVFVFLLFFVSIFGGAETVRAYVLVGSQWPQPGGLGTPITLTYSFQNMFDGGIRGPGATVGPDGVYLPNGPPLSSDLIRQSIEGALGLWASVAPINFVEVPDQGGPAIESADYVNGQFGQLRFRHVYINGPDPAPGPGQTPQDVAVAKAQAYYPSTFGNLPGDVEFDDSDPWQMVGGFQVPDIFGAATHEIGHTLGLGHTDVLGATMYPVFRRFNGPGTGFLGADDIAGIRAVYGAGQGSVTPLPAGGRQDIPILPDSTNGGLSAFDAVASGKWFGTPLAASFTSTAAAGTLFSEIQNLPMGFANPFVVSVGGSVIGQFGAGQSVDFENYPGGGVKSFTISGISALSYANPIEFPLQINLTTPTGSFTTTVIPEPTSWVLVAVGIFSWVARSRFRSTRHRSRAL